MDGLTEFFSKTLRVFWFGFRFTPFASGEPEMVKRLWLDEGGAVLSAELILLMVILVIGVSVGMVVLRDAIDAQLTEVALSIAGIDTSFSYDGLVYTEASGGTGGGAWVADSARSAVYDVTPGLAVTDILATYAATEEKADTTGS
jgi:hypothetical protein